RHRVPPPPDPPSFPTRRSSDLVEPQQIRVVLPDEFAMLRVHEVDVLRARTTLIFGGTALIVVGVAEVPVEARLVVIIVGVIGCRSEEHTSELQSRFDLVCRLLL